VAQVAQSQSGGEGLEVPRLGQLGQQALSVRHKHALLARPRTQVQVQAALKALVDVACIGRHLHSTLHTHDRLPYAKFA
jgi:hypothetical protein